jgi:hypothetical protein
MGLTEDINNLLRQGIAEADREAASAADADSIIRSYGALLKSHDRAISRLAEEIEGLHISRAAQ